MQDVTWVLNDLKTLLQDCTIKDVTWVLDDLKTLLQNCTIKDLLEGAWWLHAYYFTSPFY